MRAFRAFTGFLVTVVVGGIIVGVCLAALFPSLGILASATQYTTHLVTNLRSLDERSTIYDAGGNPIGQLGTQNRENVAIDQVPNVIVNAVVATEDKTFWTNDGVDLPSVARAALKNLTSGQIQQGGSTISQQLVKNRILTPKRDLHRKIREIMLAIQLNKDYSKREIMEQYLNTVYFGQGSYGIKAAVERLLLRPDPNALSGVHVTQLNEVSISDAALLAGLISSPEAYNPFLHPDKALERRAFVLKQMVNEHYITQHDADVANFLPLPTIKPSDDLRPRDSWTEEVQDRLFNDPRYSVLGKDKQARQDAVLRGGLQIYTTLDENAQANAQQAIADSLPDKPGFTAALVAMDPTTGAVRAMVAGPGFENSQYNIVTSTPGRQAGSTWKVITLATAMQNHYSANDTLNGTSPCSFGALGQTANAEEGEGFMSLRAATAGSVNCAFVNLELSLGFPKVIDMAHKLGITQNTLQPYLTLTLGTIEATPLEMNTVASTVADMGVHHDPYFVDKIVNRDGIVIYQEQHPGTQVLDRDAAACELDLLRGVVTGGTGTGAAVPGWALAGKTGTTDDKTNAWFLGMTPVLTSAVWYGNSQGNVPGAGFGGQIPATITRRFMTNQLTGSDPGWEPPPAWCNAPGQLDSPTGRSQQITVPDGFTTQDGKLVPAPTTPPQVRVVPPPAPAPVTNPPATRPPASAPGNQPEKQDGGNGGP
jgi:penicillin-binding protein 1A